MSTQTPTASTTDTRSLTPPRTRWAAIIWGLLFACVAGTALWMIADDDRRAAVSDWVLTLTPATISTLLLLTIGVLLLVGGAAGLVRRAQRRMTAGSAQHPIRVTSAEGLSPRQDVGPAE
jgi:cytochrome c-type biogenesis protein CcmH/NrfF